MNLLQQSISHGPLSWKDELPPSFKGWRLPGGNLQTAQGEFGAVCIQEYQAEHFSIRFNVFDILQRFVISSETQDEGLFGRLVLKGQFDQQVQDIGKYTLRQNMFNLLKPGNPVVTDIYPKKLHIFFDTFFSAELVNELVPLIPQAWKWQLGSSAFTPPHWADMETMETVHTILHCKYEKNLRRYFYESRIRDLFFNYLVQLSDYNPAEKKPQEKEIQAVLAAERLINSDITKHIQIPELAKKVLLNEFSLKAVFKKIFGMGPYEYLVRQRMKKAKSLLESGLSVKQVAAQTGYRPSDFTSAFNNFYNFPPSAVKKRN